MELRLHNRGSEDIVLDPDEEIGIIEKFTTEQVVQAYDLTTDQHLCVMEDTRESEPEPDETLLNIEDYEKIEISEIDDELKSHLKKLLNKYYGVFDWNNDTIEYTNLLEHKIIVKEDTLPSSHRPYRLSPLEAKHLQNELDKYCKLGVISPSNSPWAAPVILVKKKNGDYRMVIDYRKLNAEKPKYSPL
ncbi:hypothetical protein G6F56_012990 [Rhizopus delemar]|nr:hypothetical protein G6F56_012990 [Rhizopus delemar]